MFGSGKMAKVERMRILRKFLRVVFLRFGVRGFFFSTPAIAEQSYGLEEKKTHDLTNAQKGTSEQYRASRFIAVSGRTKAGWKAHPPECSEISKTLENAYQSPIFCLK